MIRKSLSLARDPVTLQGKAGACCHGGRDWRRVVGNLSRLTERSLRSLSASVMALSLEGLIVERVGFPVVLKSGRSIPQLSNVAHPFVLLIISK